MSEKIMLDRPVIVEGKYDKNKLSSILDAMIITTDGFGIFKEKEKRDWIRRLADEKGVIILTDSDSAGLLIRNYFNSVLPKEKMTHLYIPQIKGREKRKKEDSKEGLLGVEGIDVECLRSLLAPFASFEGSLPERVPITRTDLYEDGLLGSDGSTEKRKRLARRAGLPDNLSSGAFLDALNLLYSRSEYKEMLYENESD